MTNAFSPVALFRFPFIANRNEVGTLPTFRLFPTSILKREKMGSSRWMMSVIREIL